MARRTKIIATIGPASDSEPYSKMIEAGMDVARIGLAHGSLDDAIERYHRIRRVAAEAGRARRHHGRPARAQGARRHMPDDGAVELAAGTSVQLRARPGRAVRPPR